MEHKHFFNQYSLISYSVSLIYQRISLVSLLLIIIIIITIS